MNVERFNPVLEYSLDGHHVFVEMEAHKSGKYVRFEDYVRLMAANRKLRGQLEKRKRRNKKFIGFWESRRLSEVRFPS